MPTLAMPTNDHGIMAIVFQHIFHCCSVSEMFFCGFTLGRLLDYIMRYDYVYVSMAFPTAAFPRVQRKMKPLEGAAVIAQFGFSSHPGASGCVEVWVGLSHLRWST